MVIEAMGVKGDWPLVIAFAILAAYTYNSGCAPALISIVKDTLIYVTILVAVIYIPYKLGGYGKIFDAAGGALPQKTGPTGKPGALIPGNDAAYGAYATLALGSALALFMYPHVITGVLSMPLTFFLTNDAFYFGILPILTEAAGHYGIAPVEMARASIIGQPVHMTSPLVPAMLLLVSLARVNLADHHKKVIWRAGVCSLVMLAVAIALGVIPVG